MLQRVLGRESLMLEEKEEPSLGGVKAWCLSYAAAIAKLWEGQTYKDGVEVHQAKDPVE